jgi:hypothetical protein
MLDQQNGIISGQKTIILNNWRGPMLNRRGLSVPGSGWPVQCVLNATVDDQQQALREVSEVLAGMISEREVEPAAKPVQIKHSELSSRGPSQKS